MPTAVVPLGSELKRKKWMREGLIQAASQSFWNPMTSNSRQGIVYQQNNPNAGEGHTVVFDFSGNLSGRAVKDKETAYGKGEQKRKFSDKLTVARYRIPVNNGDVFDAVDIGDLSISQHGDSRAKLGDLFIRFKDQSIFDAGQGLLAQSPSHVIDLGTAFTFDELLEIETTLKTSVGFTSGGIRRPLEPFRTQDGRAMWLFVIDAHMAAKLRADAKFQSITASGDVRGNNNRNISGVIAKMGALIIVEGPTFFGWTSGSTQGWGLNDSEIELSGLRQYDGATASSALWTGQEGFSYASSNLHSRGLLLGAGGLQVAFGKMPDYKFQESQDFGITSESAVEFWMETRKTYLQIESTDNNDYKQAKVANIDYGVIAVDVQIGS
jgi:hypothetical protein